MMIYLSKLFSSPILHSIVFLAMSAQAAELNFELFNKDDQEITVSKIEIQGGSIAPSPGGKKIAKQGNAQAKITVTDKSAYTIDLVIQRGGLDFLFTIKAPKDKASLLTFDTKNPIRLHPESGPWKGILQKTVSGLPLGNNLSQSNIEEKLDVEFLKFAGKTQAELMKLSANEIDKLKTAFDDSKELAALPQGVKTLALQLKNGGSAAEKALFSAILNDQEFRNALTDFKAEGKSPEQIINSLQLLKKGVENNKVTEDVKRVFGSTLAGIWQEMSVKGFIDMDGWIASTSKLHMFAQAYQKYLNLPLLSVETIKMFLPDGLDQIGNIERFGKYLLQESKAAFFKFDVDQKIFNQFIKDVSVNLNNEKSFDQVKDFYKFYAETYKENLSLLMEGLRRATVFANLSPDELGQVKDLVKYAFEFIGQSPYPADIVGTAMANVIRELGDFKNSVEKKVLNGVTDKFKSAFVEEAFRIYVQTQSDLDFGEAQLLVNYYKGVIYEGVGKNDLAWCTEVGKFFRAKMKAGFTFVDILSLLQNSYKFKPSSTPKDIQNMPAALESLAKGLTKAAVDSVKISKAIQDHPLRVAGAALEPIITELLGAKDKNKAGSIRGGLEQLDAIGSQIKAVKQLQALVKENSGLLQIILPVALGGDSAVKNLLLSASRTIESNLANPAAPGDLPQLGNLVTMLSEQTQALKSPSQESIFRQLPLTDEAQKSIRFGLSKIKYLGLVDSFIARKLIANILSKSNDLKAELEPGSQEKFAQIVTPIATALAAALPGITKNFSIEKYLDFLLQIGKFQSNKLGLPQLKIEIWKLLGVLFKDLSQISTTLPQAFEAIRRFGIDDVAAGSKKPR